MSRAMTPAQRLAAYKRWGVTVVEVTRHGVSWRNHRRPASTGAWGDMNGSCTHHTGPWSTVAGIVALLWDGRSDLPGPLCDEAVSPDGRAWMIANGRANHAGKIARNVRDALVADKPLPAPGPDAVDGNAILYGDEVIHAGDGSPYPDKQVRTAVVLAAAKAEFHGWTGDSAALHKGVTTRKRDWSRSTQAWFVREVKRALKEGPSYRYPKPVAKPVLVLYKTPTSSRRYQLRTDGLLVSALSLATATKLRESHQVIDVTLPADSPMWALPRGPMA